jgi:hypothetical protein
MENLRWYSSILKGALGEPVKVRGKNDTHGTANHQLRDGSVGTTRHLQVAIPVVVGGFKEARKQRLACSGSRGKRAQQGGVAQWLPIAMSGPPYFGAIPHSARRVNIVGDLSSRDPTHQVSHYLPTG